MFRCTLMLSLAMAVSFAAARPVAPQPPAIKLTFGEDDKGLPKSPGKGQLLAGGSFVLTPPHAKPAVEFLVRAKGQNAYEVHKATIDKDQWEISLKQLPAGTYQVRVRLAAMNTATGARLEYELPDFTDKPQYIEVVVK